MLKELLDLEFYSEKEIYEAQLRQLGVPDERMKTVLKSSSLCTLLTKAYDIVKTNSKISGIDAVRAILGIEKREDESEEQEPYSFRVIGNFLPTTGKVIEIPFSIIERKNQEKFLELQNELNGNYRDDPFEQIATSSHGIEHSISYERY